MSKSEFKEPTYDFPKHAEPENKNYFDCCDTMINSFEEPKWKQCMPFYSPMMYSVTRQPEQIMVPTLTAIDNRNPQQKEDCNCSSEELLIGRKNNRLKEQTSYFDMLQQDYKKSKQLPHVQSLEFNEN